MENGMNNEEKEVKVEEVSVEDAPVVDAPQQESDIEKSQDLKSTIDSTDTTHKINLIVFFVFIFLPPFDLVR